MSATIPIDAAVEAAMEVLGERARRDEPLAPLTTYRVGGAAAVFVAAASIDDLTAVATAHAASGLPVLIVGRGSNLLVSDHGFAGIALSIGGFADHLHLDAEALVADAGAALALPALARRTAAAGLTGLEWTVGVPGSVGGAVRMNAGGHGSDVAASLIDVEVVDLSDAARPTRRAAGDLGLRFRGSDLRDDEVVVSARFRVAAGDAEASKRDIADIVRWRREHQPGGQNCGSVFVNPIPGELSAGELIDRSGLRGLRHGTAHVSVKHANFIQSDVDGSADDVHALMELVRERVLDDHGIDLRSEVRLIGFDGDEAH